MFDELTPEEKFAAEDLSVTVPRDLHRGRSRDVIVAGLLKLDWTPEAAHDYVNRFEEELRRYHESPEARAALRREQLRYVFVGTVLAVVGLAVSLCTLLFRMQGGAFAVILWGVMFLGLMLLGRGVMGLRRYRRDSLRL